MHHAMLLKERGNIFADLVLNPPKSLGRERNVLIFGRSEMAPRRIHVIAECIALEDVLSPSRIQGEAISR